MNTGELVTGSCPCSDGQVAIHLAVGPGGVLMIDSKQRTARSGPAGGGSRPAGPPQHRHAGLAGDPAALAGGRAAGPPTHRSCTRLRACGPAARPSSWPTAPRRTSPSPAAGPTAAASESAEVPHLAYGFLRPHGPVGPRMALAWPLPGQRLDLTGVPGQRRPMRPGPSSPTPGIGRSVHLSRLATSSWPRSSSGGRFVRGCCPFAGPAAALERRRPAEATRQAGDQGCCGGGGEGI